MDFDEMLDTWRAQDTAPPYGVNRDAFRQALEIEEAKVRKELRSRRRGLWFFWIFGTGMAVWAAVWIAITITNGWSVIYVITSGMSIGLFALGVGVLWVSRGREPGRNFGNTLQEEVRRSLALVDYQLSLTRYWIILLGVGCVVVGTLLFSWTTNSSQDIPDSSSGVGWFWFVVVFAVLIGRGFYKERDKMREAKAKLELRQRHLRELLAALDAPE